MGRKIEDLKTLSADYSEMIKQAGKTLEDEHSEESQLPFEMSSHSASDDGKDGQYGFLSSIREQIS